MSEKHQAACRLLAAAQEMQALLKPQVDGTHLCDTIRAVVLNAQVFEVLTRPYLQEPEPEADDDEEDEEEDT